MTAAWKKLRFILSVRSDFHIIDSLLIAVHAFVNLVSMSFSVDSTLLPRYVNLSTSLSGVPSSLIGFLAIFSLIFNSFTPFLVAGPFLIAVARTVKQPSFHLFFHLPPIAPFP